ncbi:MAG TPA: transcriptional regulator [Phycisphaerae bacterium]|jgi:HTH-type transcriptional regulator/antitoxin HigA|nr:transcriptional regulator [Phycisphaerae bacterium]
MKVTGRHRARDSYLQLVQQFPLVAIRDDAHLAAAVRVAKKLGIRDEVTLDAGESDYLDALCVLIEAYEQSHHAIEDRDLPPLEALRYLMEESGMGTADLGRLLGNRSLASQILLGKRQLSKSHVLALSRHFHVDAGLFLGE